MTAEGGGGVSLEVTDWGNQAVTAGSNPAQTETVKTSQITDGEDSCLDQMGRRHWRKDIIWQRQKLGDKKRKIQQTVEVVQEGREEEKKS